MYTYRDFVTGKIHRTRGKFVRWHQGGPLNAWYAMFALPLSSLYVPEYCLTPETRSRLPENPRQELIHDSDTPDSNV